MEKIIVKKVNSSYYKIKIFKIKKRASKTGPYIKVFTKKIKTYIQGLNITYC